MRLTGAHHCMTPCRGPAAVRSPKSLLLHTLGACEWLRGLPFSSQFAVDKQDANKIQRPSKQLLVLLQRDAYLQENAAT